MEALNLLARLGRFGGSTLGTDMARPGACARVTEVHAKVHARIRVGGSGVQVAGSVRVGSRGVGPRAARDRVRLQAGTMGCIVAVNESSIRVQLRSMPTRAVPLGTGAAGAAVGLSQAPRPRPGFRV